MLFQKIRSFYNPEHFQGWGKTRNYFEGWYFKLVDGKGDHAFAIIPGIAYNEKGDGHAFIQVLDGKKHSANYHKFSLDQFSASPRQFQIAIDGNAFNASSMTLNLKDLKGDLRFNHLVPWPKSFHSPGIMGPYRYIPFMECYHGIVSMDHTIEGAVNYNGKELDFGSGRGYIEKDWGSSFPRAYIWMQTNHFSEPGISLKASVARIPWIRKSFTGFIAGLWLKNRLFKFNTYNGTKLKKLNIAKNEVQMVLENPIYRLEIHALADSVAALVSPIKGAMEGKIEEGMSSKIEVILFNKKLKSVEFHDTGENAALEIAGMIDEIRV